MTKSGPALGLVFAGLMLIALGLGGTAVDAQDRPPPTVTPLPPDSIASIAQLAAAYAKWETSGHADTYDGGLGADTTCARCKSPLNWDPTHPAAEAALDCASCKRIPGEARPILQGGEPVPGDEWHDIGCPICHEPVGESFRIAPSFWNQQLGQYEPVETVEDLCAHCHEGSHGFQVIEEMAADAAHPGMTCIDCHDPHGGQIFCENCHDPYSGPAAGEHANHPEVHCSACHDQGGLALWHDYDEQSNYYGMVITRRFAHTLTSWPSHNLRTEVDCRRCHHARDALHPAIAQTVPCGNAACHPQGAVLYWCPFFPQGGSQ